ncbi:hypothetical protein BDV18DRAFT_97086 [Aspergillus unguis]
MRHHCCPILYLSVRAIDCLACNIPSSTTRVLQPMRQEDANSNCDFQRTLIIHPLPRLTINFFRSLLCKHGLQLINKKAQQRPQQPLTKA